VCEADVGVLEVEDVRVAHEALARRRTGVEFTQEPRETVTGTAVGQRYVLADPTGHTRIGLRGESEELNRLREQVRRGVIPGKLTRDSIIRVAS